MCRADWSLQPIAFMTCIGRCHSSSFVSVCTFHMHSIVQVRNELRGQFSSMHMITVPYGVIGTCKARAIV